jgi:tRNA threonylcarbamoyl adenosine modification protein (Sua5/YciO/YrdC/YwlC family)
MIEYVVEHNPDDRVLMRASQILRNGGLLTFPIDTNWIVVADAFNRQGIEKLYRLRHVENTKHLTLLCSNFNKAQEIAFIEDSAFRLIKKVVPGPYTFIFPAHKKIQKMLKASKYDHQVGLRFPPSALCQKLMDTHGELLISSHLTHEMLSLDDDGIPLYGALIEDAISNQIDLILDTGDYQFIGPTSIIDFTSGSPEVVREGSGNIELFL